LSHQKSTCVATWFAHEVPTVPSVPSTGRHPTDIQRTDRIGSQVLRLWPSETDHQGTETCKKCAWVTESQSESFFAQIQRVFDVEMD
jgi:hypothetical protein